MQHFAITTIWLSTIVLPCLLFLVANSFSRTSVTLARAFVAVLAGWALVAAYGIAAHAINLSASRTDAELEALYSGDGAALAFSAMFGWVGPLLVVCITWAVRASVHRLLGKASGA